MKVICMQRMRGLAFVVLLMIGVPTLAGEENSLRRNFLKDSPEYVVRALMNFDFNGETRQNPDTYPQWFPLTTHGEPDFSESSPYWACKLGYVIRSYKVSDREIVATDRVRVPVEVEMVALIATADTLKKHIDQCYWPELSTSIYNSATGETISLRHPLSAQEFLKLIAHDEFGARFFHGDYANRDEHLIPIAKNMRKWRFKVDVVLENGAWRISTDLLPPEYWGLRRAIKYMGEHVKGNRDGIKICAGLLAPPSPYYKQYECPPAGFPEKELIHALDKLNILNAIQGEQK